mmetsp:Transcript_70544/g.210356  ORF Transcript_70544/g.210356 Transcript_70544/m.210356 type:complete len:305 (-) Transcript_70544:53-967(-)
MSRRGLRSGLVGAVGPLGDRLCLPARGGCGLGRRAVLPAPAQGGRLRHPAGLATGAGAGSRQVWQCTLRGAVGAAPAGAGCAWRRMGAEPASVLQVVLGADVRLAGGRLQQETPIRRPAAGDGCTGPERIVAAKRGQMPGSCLHQKPAEPGRTNVWAWSSRTFLAVVKHKRLLEGGPTGRGETQIEDGYLHVVARAHFHQRRPAGTCKDGCWRRRTFTGGCSGSPRRSPGLPVGDRPCGGSVGSSAAHRRHVTASAASAAQAKRPFTLRAAGGTASASQGHLCARARRAVLLTGLQWLVGGLCS